MLNNVGSKTKYEYKFLVVSELIDKKINSILEKKKDI